jgi:heterodisulfide reductase subunit A-like polyferredoxin
MKRQPVEITSRARPLHIPRKFITGWDNGRTICGRISAAVQFAKTIEQASCSKCRRKADQFHRNETQRIGHRRNLIESQAKAIYGIWASRHPDAPAWEYIPETERGSWYEILSYTAERHKEESKG